jgi:GAF domain-containing protein
MGTLAVMVSITRERIERDRMAELRGVNKKLQELSISLEQRVEERTNDIALASELGRRISLVRDMDTLLSDTVNLIRDHFNLYYTQVYLVDQTTRSLVFKSGTGKIGKEMVRRSHRLAVDLTSINGTAVTERRAVIVEDTHQSLNFRPNDLLPETRSEMAIPLISGERVLGVIDLQSSQPGALTADNLAVFETIAGQLAIALLNVELFGQVQQSLAEVEAHSRREVRQGWDEYLDGIEIKERIGYTFDQSRVVPLEEKLVETAEPCALTAPLELSGESIGMFQLVSDRPWSMDDQETARVVAYQVAQQIENLRLLDQAERFRRDAEEAMRRLSRQGWGDFIESSQTGEAAFAYTGEQVQSIEAGQNGHANEIHIDIKVQDEPIGQFGLSGIDSLLPEDEELMLAVSEQLGSHLENLRLYASSQQELGERQRAEQALQESFAQAKASEALVRTVIDSTPDWIFIKDQEHRYRLANKGYADSLHIPVDGFIGKNDLDLGFPEELVKGNPEQGIAGFWADDRAVMDSGQPKVIPNDIVTIDDKQRTFNTIKTPLSDASGSVWGVLAFGRDVTEREELLKDLEKQQQKLQEELTERLRTEQALRKSETELSGALRVARMGYWELDLATSMFTFNDDFYAMLHTTAEAEGGYQISAEQYARKFAHPEDAKLVVDETIKAIETTDPNYTSHVEHRFYYADGEMGYLNVTITIVKDENGKTIKTRGVNQDITERRMAQDIITKRAGELATVADVAMKVSTIQTPDEMLQTVVDLTKQAFNLYHAHIYLFNETDETLLLTKGAGEVGRQMVAEGRKIGLNAEKSLVARAARTRQGVIVNDVRQDTDFLPHPLLPETHSEMAVPMVVGDHLLGVIDVQDEEVSRFTQEDVNILTTLSAQVAVSLQNARSYARAQRQAEREALINSISERIQATNSVENALQVAVREIGRALGAQHTAIRLGLDHKASDQQSE